MNKKLILNLTVLAFATSAHAHRYWHHWWCGEYSTLSPISSQIISLDSDCTSKPLATDFVITAKGRQNTWQGGFERTAIVRDTYLWQQVNGCTGQVISSRQTESTGPTTMEFVVPNANLVENLPESYAAMPRMTYGEASEAMGVALARCENIHVGDAPPVGQ